MAVEQQTRKFGSYFCREAKTIVGLVEGVASPGQLTLYRKTLLVSILDCLAGIRFSSTDYPQLARKNRERFTRFVAEYGEWPEGELVSGPFLLSRLEKEKLDGKLVETVRKKVGRYSTRRGNELALDKLDSGTGELLSLASTEKEEVAIRDNQHFSLLYRYRNHLVHEFREPGYGMEVFSEDGETPCYHGYIDDPHWYLVYPVGLFERLIESSVENLEGYFVEHNLDPYDHVGDTSRW